VENRPVRRLAAEAVIRAVKEHAIVTEALQSLADEIGRSASLIVEAIANGGKVMLCGNGGSASDAQHIAGELVGRFLKERRALPAEALSTNSSVVTAIANDYGFDQVFARQVLALGTAGDVLIAISTSGNSQNVVQAAQAGRQRGFRVIGLTGSDGGKLKDQCELCLCIPSTSVPRIQEMHILVGHVICQLVEEAFC